MIHGGNWLHRCHSRLIYVPGSTVSSWPLLLEDIPLSGSRTDPGHDPGRPYLSVIPRAAVAQSRGVDPPPPSSHPYQAVSSDLLVVKHLQGSAHNWYRYSGSATNSGYEICKQDVYTFVLRLVAHSPDGGIATKPAR
jgi:hypothetical protein